MNVGEALIQTFVQEGVKVGSGISGGSTRNIANAVYRNLRLCYARHERGAVDIADGYGRVSGVPAVVFADSGPAVGNTMAGIIQAFGDSTPLIFVAAKEPRVQLGRRGYKEIPVREIFGPVTRWTAGIEHPSQVAEIARRAFTFLRCGRPGPIVIELPVDVSSAPVDDFHYERVPQRIRWAGDPAEIERAVQLLASAQRPYLYVGAGVLFSEASDELVKFAELLSIPVGTTLNGKSAFPEDHPLSLGISGYPRATYSSLHAAEYARSADVVLTIGCGFKEHALREQYEHPVKLIQVDVDPTEINKLSLAEVPIVGDARLVLRQLCDAAESNLPGSKLGMREDVLRQVADGRAEWMELSRPQLTSDEKPINPFRVTWEVNRLVDPKETIVLHDAGSTRGSTCQHIVSTTPRGFLGMGVQSAMGWSLGAAIGAKLAAPEKLVIPFIGDQAFGEVAMELETATRNEVPILVLLNNNAGVPEDHSRLPHISMVKQYAVGGDYTALARALGAEALRIEDPSALEPGLKQAIQTVKGGRTMLVEVVTRRAPTTLFPLEGGGGE